MGEIATTRPQGQISNQSVLISRELWRRLIDYRAFKIGTDGNLQECCLEYIIRKILGLGGRILDQVNIPTYTHTYTCTSSINLEIEFILSANQVILF